MTIRILRPFAGYKAGQVFDWADGMARIFVSRGLVQEVVETAAVENRAEQAVVQQQYRRRMK